MLKKPYNFRDRFSETTPSRDLFSEAASSRTGPPRFSRINLSLPVVPPVTAHRKLARGPSSRPTYSPRDHEGFQGRFSTTTPKGASLEMPEWARRAGSWLVDVLRGRWQILLMLVLAFNLVFGVVRPFIAEPMLIPSKSMSPTLQPGDRILTNKMAYDFSPPERGDIAVFENPGKKGKARLVKRVVGVPGDEIQIKNGVLLVNGTPPFEPYKKHRPGDPAPKNPKKAKLAASYGPIIVPENHMFVLGDNRNDSYDSRYFGPVPDTNLIGEATLILWPPGRLGTP